MNEIKALVARLIQNPEVVKSIANPQALAKLAGIGPGVLSPGVLNEDKLKAVAGLGKTLYGLLTGPAKPSSGSSSPAPSSQRTVAVSPSGGTKNTAIVGTVSLTAIAGAVAAVGTVSVVALSKGCKARKS